VDYRDVLATVVGASVAGIIAFVIRLAFDLDAAVLALIYAATYSLLWSIVGEHARLIFHRRLPEHTRFDGHWRLITGGIALAAALCAGIVVAFAVSRHSFSGDPAQSDPSVPLTRTLALRERVVVTRKTIVLPTRTMVVTAPVTIAATRPTPTRRDPQTSTILQRTVVVVRPPITVTVSSTASRTTTVTRPSPTVTAPRTVTTVTTAPATTVTTATTTTTPGTTTTTTATTATVTTPDTVGTTVVTDPLPPPAGP
jgi:hypothetical protein